MICVPSEQDSLQVRMTEFANPSHEGASTLTRRRYTRPVAERLGRHVTLVLAHED